MRVAHVRVLHTSWRTEQLVGVASVAEAPLALEATTCKRSEKVGGEEEELNMTLQWGSATEEPPRRLSRGAFSLMVKRA